MFITVFVLAFMTSDYLITGSVTETWIAIAVVSGILTAILRWFVSELFGLMLR